MSTCIPLAKKAYKMQLWIFAPLELPTASSHTVSINAYERSLHFVDLRTSD